MNTVEKSARTVDDAITEALIELGVTSSEVEIEVLEKGPKGFFGIFSNKKAKVRVTKKVCLEEIAKTFLEDMFSKMKMQVEIEIGFENDKDMKIELSGENMGMLIGKRGQTLDSIQYLVSLVVNKNSDHFIRIKMDTEGYRDRRKKTLENLAFNLANKVKKSGRKFTLEPMNPSERRIIHATLQNVKNVDTYSEGDEPHRRVVIVSSKKREDNRPHTPYKNRKKYNEKRNTETVKVKEKNKVNIQE